LPGAVGIIDGTPSFYDIMLYYRVSSSLCLSRIVIMYRLKKLWRKQKAFKSSICGGYEEKTALNDVLHNLDDSSTWCYSLD
jgi:hypothetical protein